MSMAVGAARAVQATCGCLQDHHHEEAKDDDCPGSIVGRVKTSHLNGKGEVYAGSNQAFGKDPAPALCVHHHKMLDVKR